MNCPESITPAIFTGYHVSYHDYLELVMTKPATHQKLDITPNWYGPPNTRYRKLWLLSAPEGLDSVWRSVDGWGSIYVTEKEPERYDPGKFVPPPDPPAIPEDLSEIMV